MSASFTNGSFKADSLQPKVLNIPNYKGAYIVSRRLYSVKYVGPNVLILCLDT